MKNKFYITTSIAYTNARPHIGYALELLQADVLARIHRQKGEDVFFLTGTDENGKKIQEKAEEEGKDTQEFVDEISGIVRDLAKRLEISNNFFIRTTDKKVHFPTVNAVWSTLEKNGDIYKGEYKALYCVGCEGFVSEKDLEDGLCPAHKNPPEKVSEENYFFRLSRYKDKVKELIEKDEIKILPEKRKKEILNLFSDSVSDVSFSRPKSSVGWGIDVPGDDSQKIYVWADALTNYISGLGGLETEKFKKYWPADVHVIGKDIIRFHAMFWPAMLLSLNLPLPKKIYVHGFISHNGIKMSKSLGNVVDPFLLIEKYGLDATRYYLLREIPSDDDGNFSDSRFKERYGDLSNKLGNLVLRVSAIAEKNKGILVDIKISENNETEIIKEVISAYAENIEKFNLNIALENVFKLVDASDKKVEETKLWELAKKDADEFKKVIEELVLNIAYIAYLLVPFLPATSVKIFFALGISADKTKWKEKTLNIKKPEPLFPRLD